MDFKEFALKNKILVIIILFLQKFIKIYNLENLKLDLKAKVILIL